MTITDAKTQGRESSLSATLSAIIACPRCKQSLADVGSLDCDVCALSFPIVGGVPILINEEASIFALDDYISQTPAVQDSWLKQAAKTAALDHAQYRLRRKLPAACVVVKERRHGAAPRPRHRRCE